MHPELIEWTWNKREKEFRLLEPEAIAVWWGYHKNKVNMNYEKFSRSLRYYYDKGILRKIPGEHYVYCFCIDPEQMYKHMGYQIAGLKSNQCLTMQNEHFPSSKTSMFTI